MALDPKTIEQLTAHINSKWKSSVCSLCGENEWTVQGFIRLNLSTTSGATSLGGPGLPSAAVICGNCGQTIIVNLIMAGIVKKDG